MNLAYDSFFADLPGGWTFVAYRKSLIHECVTGQRRVTEADARKIHQY